MSQTEAQVQTEIKDTIALFHELAKAGNINTGTLQSQTISNYVAREATILADQPGNYSAQSRSQLASLRAAFAGLLVSSSVRAILGPLFRNYAENSSGFAGATDGVPVETDPVAILSRIYKHFISTSKTVQSRNITFATPAAGSNIGTGVINRLTVDAYGYNIEACHVEAKRAECIQSAQTGTPPGEEVFQFRGSTRAVDQVPLMTTSNATGGSAGSFRIAAVSGRNSLLANPSFENYSGASASGGQVTSITTLSSWITGSGVYTGLQLDGRAGKYYRTYQGVTTPYALVMTTPDYIYQTSDVNNIQFAPNNPYYFQVAYNREIGLATGLLTITLGNSTSSVTLAAQTGWNILRLTLDRRIWPHNFTATTQDATSSSLLTIKIQWSGGTGSLYIDEALLYPMTLFDGHWYCIAGGQTNFVADNHDVFTWTDTFAAGTNNSWDVGIIQTWLWRSYGAYLPSTTGAPTWADPVV